MSGPGGKTSRHALLNLPAARARRLVGAVLRHRAGVRNPGRPGLQRCHPAPPAQPFPPRLGDLVHLLAVGIGFGGTFRRATSSITIELA